MAALIRWMPAPAAALSAGISVALLAIPAAVL
jgi:hypothetical protein